MKKQCSKDSRWQSALKLAMTVMLAASTFWNGGAGSAKVEAAETELQNPRIVTDSSMEAGQKVTWDCVWFGSYPQTEVVLSGSDEETALEGMNKYYTTEYESVDEAEFAVIKNADYDSNGDSTTAIDGYRYRRVLKSDASKYSDASEYFYKWTDSSTYHYFRYEPIKWRVLNVADGKAFLLADVVLDDQEYNTEYTEITWEKSTIRSFLNNYGSSENTVGSNYSSKGFLNNALSSSEQSAIQTASLTNADNLEYSTEGGNNTEDKVFLLSETECWGNEAASYGFVNYNIDDEARQGKTSTYAYAMGAYRDTSKSYAGNSIWWLRSPGVDSDDAAAVWASGFGYTGGSDLTIYFCEGIRPALYLDFSETEQYSYAGTVCSDGTVDEDTVPEAKSYTNVKGIVNKTGQVVFDCDEEDFSLSSYTYNHGFGQMASALSGMVYSTDENIKDLLENKLEYESTQIYEDPTGDTEGLYAPFTIAHKKIMLDEEETEILLVMVRGTYHVEWIDNFDSGRGDTHEGFERASDYVLKKINSYINTESYGFDKSAKTKVFVTGHSRGAAVANLLGKEMDDGNLNIDVAADDIFVYTFATPNTTSSYSRKNTEYKNIFNVVNPEDFVTKVMPSAWGYGRYGVTYVLPSKTTEATGVSNYVNYSEYLEELQGWYSKTNPDEKEYVAYEKGMTELSKYVSYITEKVENVNDYYYKNLKNGDTGLDESDWALHNLYKYALGGNQSKNTVLEQRSIGIMGQAASGWYGQVGQKTIAFFFENQVMKPKFACAHMSETYYAAMKSLSEKELKQSRRTLKGIVNCPVDVTVYDEENNIVGKIKDNEVDETIEDGITMEVEGDSKTFYLPSSADYKVVLTGNDEGAMDYSLCEVDPDIGETARVYYEDVPVENGKEITQEVTADTSLNSLKLTETSTESTVSGTYYDSTAIDGLEVEVTVEGTGLADSQYNLTPGDYVTLQAEPDENNTFLGWYDSDGTLVSEDAEYSFSIHESEKFTAKFTNNVVAQTGIELEKTSYKLNVGDVITLEASVLPKNATDKNLTYTSSDESVVSVDEMGIVQALKNGKAEIAVATEDGKYQAKYQITVGDTKASTGETSCSHSWGKWTTVSKATVFTPKQQKRTCSRCGKTEKRGVGSKAEPYIVLNTGGFSITDAKYGQSFQIKVIGKANGDYVKSWKSSNTKIAKVSQTGKVKIAKKKKLAGKKVYITVKMASGEWTRVTVRVNKKKVSASLIEASVAKKTIKVGQKTKITASAWPITVTDKITFKSSNKKIATVNKKGVVKGKKKGTAKITVKCGKKKKVIKIKVK